MKKALKRTGIIILGIIILLVIVVVIFFGNMLATLFSMKTISTAPAYEISYHGGYNLDEYLEQGISSMAEQMDFVDEHVGNGAAKLLLEASRGCSAFFATTPEGDMIFARNFDTPNGIGAITTTDGTEGYRSILFSQVNWMDISRKDELTFDDKLVLLGTPYMVADGINEKGLAAAFFTAQGTKTKIDDTKTTLHDFSVVSILLTRTATVDEAIALLSEYNVLMWNLYPSQYMLCDASGASAIIEYVDGEMQVLRKQGDYQICSNFLIYNNPNLVGEGSDRYRNYETALSASNGVITTEDSLELLKKNPIKGMEAWSVVYNLTQKTATVTFFDDYDNVMTYGF